jgi:hypothetical protein
MCIDGTTKHDEEIQIEVEDEDEFEERWVASRSGRGTARYALRLSAQPEKTRPPPLLPGAH